MQLIWKFSYSSVACLKYVFQTESRMSRKKNVWNDQIMDKGKNFNNSPFEKLIQYINEGNYYNALREELAGL